MSGSVTLTLGPSPARGLIGGCAGMTLGALLGDWLLSHAHPYAPLVPLLVVALVIVIAWVWLGRPRGIVEREEG
ncbi:hypothetical protein ACFQYP_18055 [Nonomuraea antimicrobica]